MGDMGDMYHDWEEIKRALKKECPGCRKVRPKANPSKLMPGQKCKVCEYIRPEETQPDLIKSFITPVDSHYLALWVRMNKCVCYFTEESHKLKGRAAKRFIKERKNLIDLADHLMIDFFLCMGDDPFDGILFETVIRELERHVNLAEESVEEYKLKGMKMWRY